MAANLYGGSCSSGCSHGRAPPDPDVAVAVDDATSIALDGETEKALLLFQKIVQQAPAHAKAWEAVAQLELELDDPMAAVRSVVAARRATALLPDWVEAQTTLGRALLAVGRWQEAVTVLEGSGGGDDLADARRMAEAESRCSGEERYVRLRTAGVDLRVPREGAALQGTASRVWECGVALAMGLDWAGVRLAGVKCVELGAGSGLAGAAAAYLGADVLLTDVDEAATAACVEEHAEAAGRAGGSLRSAVLDWRVDDTHRQQQLYKCHLILAADSIYHRDALEPWLATVDTARNKTPGALLLYAHKRRHALVSALRQRGELRQLALHPLHTSDRIDIWLLLKANDHPPASPALAPLIDQSTSTPA